MLSRSLTLFSSVALVALLAVTTACSETTTYETEEPTSVGESMENAAEETGEAMKNAAEETGDAMEEASESAHDAVDHHN